jgi:hypothetical protein
MSKATYTLQIDDHNRLCAYVDGDYYQKEDIVGEGLNIQPIQFFDKYSRDVFSTNDDYKGDIARLVDAFHYYNHERNYAELRERAVSLYLNSKGLPFKFVSLYGYSQGERIDLVIYGDTAEDTWITDPKSHLALEAWYRGDIFTIVHERLTRWTSETGATYLDWENVDSLGCCLLETGEDGLTDYLHNFDLEKKELENA